jgi:hypothetical protein
MIFLRISLPRLLLATVAIPPASAATVVAAAATATAAATAAAAAAAAAAIFAKDFEGEFIGYSTGESKSVGISETLFREL